jgi:quinol monooxygenase YgiN
VETIDLFDSFIGPVSMQPCCLRAGLYAEINNGDDMVLLEEWYSREDLERHIFSDNSQKILAEMDVTEEKMGISFHTVSSTPGFELLKRSRKRHPTHPGAGDGIARPQGKREGRSLWEIVRIGPWLLAFDDFPVKQIGLQFCWGEISRGR